LASHPALAPAIERAKGKIAIKARVEAEALGSNLKLILRDWVEEPAISSIGWASPMDPVAPEFAVDQLVDRLAQKLSEVRFAQFLERFTDGLIDLDANERRSQ
jgi:hypothetical protein